MIRQSTAQGMRFRRMELPLAFWLVVMPFASAANIPVDGTICTLVDAITAANSDSATGGCLAGSGAEVLDLQVDISLSAADNSTHGPTGLPVIASMITIQGNEHTIARTSGSGFRIFAINSTGHLVLENTTISGGSAPVSPPYPNAYLDGGGAILNYAGIVTLSNSTLSGNTADGPGGALYNLPDSTAIFTNSTLSGNTSTTDSGGGIFNGNDSMLTLTNSTVSGNSTGVSASPYTFHYGGGIFNDNGGTIHLTNSTVSGNSATEGGGIYNSSSGFGGYPSVYFSTTVTLTNSTLSGNSSGFSAANIHNSDGGGYYPGHVTLTNSIVHGGNCIGPIISGGTSFGCGGTAITNLAAALAENGGPTKTHALLTGSNAIDVAGACGLATDQRGVPRPAGACDSGAFELAPPAACTAANGANHTLHDDTLLDAQTFEVCDTIDVGPNYQVAGPDGNLTLRAGKAVIFKDGASVGVDGQLEAEIDSSLQAPP